jgi:cysteine desulfurase
MTMRRIYLDNNATTPLLPEVLEAMRPYWLEHFGNASSTHWQGQRAREAVEESRERVARLINAQASEIVFTSGGTEGDNTAVFGVMEAAAALIPGQKRIITSSIEHPAVLNAAKVLEQRGVAVSFVPAGATGVVDPSEVESAIRPETVLISIMHANNELGTIQPIDEIGRIARAHGVPLHTDAVQSVGKTCVDVDKLGVDLLTLSAHKLHGPKGVGALYVRKGTRFRPLFYGGHHERDRRAGTENVPGIVGLGKAAELALADLDQESNRLRRLRDRLETGILREVPFSHVNGDEKRRLPGTTNMRFEFVDGEALVIAMDLAGVCCSTGSACSSGSLEPSHVLAASGLTREEARSSVRFSLGRYNSEEDIDYTLQVLPPVVERLRSLSAPYQPVPAHVRN